MITGLMVTRNEAHRYLKACIDWNIHAFDRLLVFDDASTDATVDIARGRGAEVAPHDRGGPSFLEHEGRFRQASLVALCERGYLTEGDWVFSIDADEFLVSTNGVGDTLVGLIRRAAPATMAIALSVPEVWRIETHPASGIVTSASRRVDGYWDTNIAPRLWRVTGTPRMADKKMGCGPAPTYVTTRSTVSTSEVEIQHYGYALPEDRQAKYRRYAEMADHGHNQAHIDSIMTSPQLEKVEGDLPYVYRGE